MTRIPLGDLGDRLPSLLKAWRYLLIAAATLALGIGAAAVIFSVVRRSDDGSIRDGDPSRALRSYRAI